MTLEQVLHVIEGAEAAGKTTVRLHTGDPSLYGAPGRAAAGAGNKKHRLHHHPGGVQLSGGGGGAGGGVHAARRQPERDPDPAVRPHAGAGARIPARPGRPRGQPGAVFERGAARPGPARAAPGRLRGRRRRRRWSTRSAGRRSRSPGARWARWPRPCARWGRRGRALVLVGGFLTGRGARSCLYDPGFATAFRPGEGEKEEGAR